MYVKDPFKPLTWEHENTTFLLKCWWLWTYRRILATSGQRWICMSCLLHVKCNLHIFLRIQWFKPYAMEVCQKFWLFELLRRVVWWLDTNVRRTAPPPWRWRQRGRPKHWYLTNKLYGRATQKITNSLFTAVKTWTLAPRINCSYKFQHRKLIIF